MAHIEQTRAVVESGETFDGKIIPTARAELGRPVRVQKDATVQGSVYGEVVETAPGSVIEGSVMASDGVEMNGGHVTGEVGTPGKVLAEDARVSGTVTGKRIRLTDCVVRGNVVGTEVILENCVVLGIVTADRHLTVENSLCYTFRGHGEMVLDEATLVLPQAIADGSLELKTPIDVAGLGQLNVASDHADTEDSESGRLPEMTAEDRYERNGTTYLTLAPRVLNLQKVTDRLDELERGLMEAVNDTRGDRGVQMSVEDVLGLLDVDAAVANTGD